MRIIFECAAQVHAAKRVALLLDPYLAQRHRAADRADAPALERVHGCHPFAISPRRGDVKQLLPEPFLILHRRVAPGIQQLGAIKVDLRRQVDEWLLLLCQQVFVVYTSPCWVAVHRLRKRIDGPHRLLVVIYPLRGIFKRRSQCIRFVSSFSQQPFLLGIIDLTSKWLHN